MGKYTSRVSDDEAQSRPVSKKPSISDMFAHSRPWKLLTSLALVSNYFF